MGISKAIQQDYLDSCPTCHECGAHIESPNSLEEVAMDEWQCTEGHTVTSAQRRDYVIGLLREESQAFAIRLARLTEILEGI